MQRLPNLAGLKSEVIVPEYSHNVYDHAIRMLGVKLILVKDKAELESAFNERTAMAYVLAGPGDDGPLGTRVVAEATRRHNVPLVVDAAAEILTLKPNVHLERGANVVAYSGGKCIRGPQAAGVLLGEKKFLQAAWANSAPHHAFGRSVKVGKEEIMGMLAAVEMWVKRDHKAEWAMWENWLGQIATSVKRVDGVTTNVRQPSADLSNRTPELVVQWDAGQARHLRPGRLQAAARNRAAHQPGAARAPTPSRSFLTRCRPATRRSWPIASMAFCRSRRRSSRRPRRRPAPLRMSPASGS